MVNLLHCLRFIVWGKSIVAVLKFSMAHKLSYNLTKGRPAGISIFDIVWKLMNYGI